MATVQRTLTHKSNILCEVTLRMTLHCARNTMNSTANKSVPDDEKMDWGVPEHSRCAAYRVLMALLGRNLSAVGVPRTTGSSSTHHAWMYRMCELPSGAPSCGSSLWLALHAGSTASGNASVG